jgi:DNA-binding LacI/PurR family transcriptional regulator
MAKSHIDSVSVDDFSGGVSAAHLILKHVSRAREVTVLQGPTHDARNNERVEGFLSIIPRATVFTAGSWEYEKGYEISVQVAANMPNAVFCTNDRLASSFLNYCRDNDLEIPGVVGFDNAPVSEQLDLTTIAIPWDQMIRTIVEIADRRLAGDTQNSIQYILNTIPIIRDPFFHG